MNPGALRALEFDRIVDAVTALAVTPTGRERLGELHPSVEIDEIRTAQQATSEGTRFLADHPGFPLRAPSDLDTILDALTVEGRALEAVRLRGLADYLESVEHSRSVVAKLGDPLPLLRALVERVASFKGEIADVRRKIDAAGDVDRRFKALDVKTGAVLWETRLPTSVQGFPVTFRIDGKQYVAVTTGNGGGSPRNVPATIAPDIHSPATGNGLYVFALPD